MQFSKKTAKKIKAAIVAYNAFCDANNRNDDNSRKVWARMIRENADVFAAVGKDVSHIIKFIDEADRAHLGETVAEYHARRAREYGSK